MSKLADVVVGLSLAVVALMTCAWGLPALDPQADAAARRLYDQVQSGDLADIQATSGDELKAPGAAAQFQRLRAIIPAGRPKTIKTIGWNYFNVVGGTKTVQVTQEYDYGGRVALVQTTFSRPSDSAAWAARGFHVNVATAAQLSANKLTLLGRSPLEFAFLAATLLSPALMVAALVKVIRTPGLKRKWLWGILAFFGLCAFHLNWTTGQVEPIWATVQLIGAGVVRGASKFSPWVLSFTFPLGALLILTGVWANPSRAKPTDLRTAPAGS